MYFDWLWWGPIDFTLGVECGEFPLVCCVFRCLAICFGPCKSTIKMCRLQLSFVAKCRLACISENQ